MIDTTRCPNCGKCTMEEHGTEPGDHHWWFCRSCGCQLHELKEPLSEQAKEKIQEVKRDAL